MLKQEGSFPGAGLENPSLYWVIQKSIQILQSIMFQTIVCQAIFYKANILKKLLQHLKKTEYCPIFCHITNMKTRNFILLSVVQFAVYKANTVNQKDSGFINHCKLSNIYSKVSSLASETSRELYCGREKWLHSIWPRHFNRHVG